MSSTVSAWTAPQRWDPDPPSKMADANGRTITRSVADNVRLPDITSLTNRLLTDAESALDRMERLAFLPLELTFTIPHWNGVSPPPTLTGVTLPTMKDITFTPADAPAQNFGSLDVSDILIPILTDQPPTLAFGTMPARDYGDAPTKPLIDLNLVVPAAPTISLPDKPALMSISDIPFDGVTLPTFDATEPTLNLVAPALTPFVEPPGYVSPMLDALRADIMRAMSDGDWTGLPGAIEQGLWDREREREAIAQAQALADLDKMEKTGFAIAPGVFVDARLKITLETNAKIVGLSREIMIKQAELHLANIMKMRELGVTLEGKLMDLFNQVAARALEAAKYTTQAQVEVYNAGVRAYAAQLEGFKARATVYEVQLRGALAVVEVFKARVDAEKAKAEINHSLVAAYKTEVEAAMAYVEIFKAQLQAVQIEAQLQKTKVEAYGEEVRAFTARVGAYTAQVEGYKTGVQAQAVGMDAYKSRVDAYRAQVGAGVEQMRARIEAFRGKISGYEAQVVGFKADLDGRLAVVKATEAWNSTRVEAFRAQVQGVSSYNDAITKQWQAGADVQVKSYELGVKVAETEMRMAATKLGLTSEMMRAYGQVAGQLGAAALNAVHYGVNLSWSQAESWAQSYGTSESHSVSESTSESTTYSASA